MNAHRLNTQFVHVVALRHTNATSGTSGVTAALHTSQLRRGMAGSRAAATVRSDDIRLRVRACAMPQLLHCIRRLRVLRVQRHRRPTERRLPKVLMRTHVAIRMKAWIEPWWAQLGSVTGVGCRCEEDAAPSRPSWSCDVDGTPLHQCGYPSEAWIRSQREVLNIFQGGEHHNELVETADLTSDSQYSWISAYSWTAEKLVGSLTGREARVWRYKEPNTP